MYDKESDKWYPPITIEFTIDKKSTKGKARARAQLRGCNNASIASAEARWAIRVYFNPSMLRLV